MRPGWVLLVVRRQVVPVRDTKESSLHVLDGSNGMNPSTTGRFRDEDQSPVPIHEPAWRLVGVSRKRLRLRRDWLGGHDKSPASCPAGEVDMCCPYSGRNAEKQRAILLESRPDISCPKLPLLYRYCQLSILLTAPKTHSAHLLDS